MTAIKRAGQWLADAVGAVLIALALLVITGCATEPLKPAPAVRVAVATATLSTPGTCEHYVAPLLTQATHAVRVADARLKVGQITPERARRVLDVSGDARAAIVAACLDMTAKQPPDPAALAKAKALVDSLNFLVRP